MGLLVSPGEDTLVNLIHIIGNFILVLLAGEYLRPQKGKESTPQETSSRQSLTLRDY